jgi:hypothetical protein
MISGWWLRLWRAAYELVRLGKRLAPGSSAILAYVAGGGASKLTAAMAGEQSPEPTR